MDLSLGYYIGAFRGGEIMDVGNIIEHVWEFLYNWPWEPIFIAVHHIKAPLFPNTH